MLILTPTNFRIIVIPKAEPQKSIHNNPIAPKIHPNMKQM